MKRVNLKAYLVSAFCLIVFAGFTQAQTESAEPGLAAKAESNEIELARQKTIRRWRQLKPGMTEKQVRKILGKPKLIQSGSHECVWFYQYVPVLNAKPSFEFRGIKPQKEVKSRYGAVVEKIGVSDVGGIKHGIVFFEARSLESLIDEVRAKYDKAIAEMEAKCEKDIASFRVPQIREHGGYWYDSPDVKERYAKGRELIRERYRIAIEKLEKQYNKQVRRLSDNPRSPVFVLRFFNQPDWSRFEELLVNEKPYGIKAGTRIEKWKKPRVWRKLLKINMPLKKVHALLGELERSETNVQGTRECYGDVSGHGELFFTARSDSEECLDSWTEPFWPVVEKSLHAENKIRRKAKRRVGD